MLSSRSATSKNLVGLFFGLCLLDGNIEGSYVFLFLLDVLFELRLCFRAMTLREVIGEIATINQRLNTLAKSEALKGHKD